MKYADVIRAALDGKSIQCSNSLLKIPVWVDVVNIPYAISTIAHENVNYIWRIKPKDDMVVYSVVTPMYHSQPTVERKNGDNLKSIYDGETGQLKSVEMIQ